MTDLDHGPLTGPRATTVPGDLGAPVVGVDGAAVRARLAGSAAR